MKDGYICIETVGMTFEKTTVSFSGKEKYREALDVKDKIIELMENDK